MKKKNNSATAVAVDGIVTGTVSNETDAKGNPIPLNWREIQDIRDGAVKLGQPPQKGGNSS